MSQQKKQTKFQQANSTLLAASKRIVFLDIGQLEGSVYSWDKGPNKGLSARITDNAVFAWEKTPGGDVISTGSIYPPKTAGYFMAGYEMFLSPATVDAKTRAKKDFIAAVFKYFYNKAAKQWTSKYEKDEVVIVIPVPRYYNPKDKEAIKEAATLAGLCEHGSVHLEDSLDILVVRSAQLANEGFSNVIRWINANAPMIESVDTYQGEVPGSARQHYNGLPKMIQGIEEISNFTRAWQVKKAVHEMILGGFFGGDSIYIGNECINFDSEKIYEYSRDFQNKAIASAEYGQGSKTKGELRLYGTLEANSGDISVDEGYTVESLSLGEIFFRAL
ncbi:hypothetical protein [Parasitella parasitica]|uniref:Uncharacterized protein n=1 Tax=Parasitella parasitica TaxID=35722 RepID=A0A0B7N321_9FUNG|nr:hypothetical protein [Parasitella parasitica]